MQTNAAVAEPMVEKMKKRNETSAADRIRSYLRHPGSGVLALLTIGAAVVTFAVLIFLVAYILVKGIPYLTPSLFSLEYTSENVSLMPSSDQHFYYDSFVAGNCSTTWDLCCDLPCRICKKRK